MTIITKNDIALLEKRYRTTLINSVSGFKSLQLVGTVSQSGNTNLALFNSIFHVGASPSLIGMVVRPDGREHDTLNNISSTGVYTINNVTKLYYQQAHQTSARYPSGESEFAACGFEEEYLPGFIAPFVKQSTIKIGLKLQEVIPVKSNGTQIVIGEIQLIKLNENYLGNDGFADPQVAGTITCCGLDSYYQTTHLGRLTYAKPGAAVHKL